MITLLFLLSLLTSANSYKKALVRVPPQSLSRFKLRSSSLADVCKVNPDGIRVFHPAFPLQVLEPITLDDANKLIKLQDLLGKDPIPSKHLSSLPWKPLPAVKISSNDKEIWSKTEIGEAYEKFKHTGHLVWAHKIETPEPGCLLLNHWQQRVMYISEYDPEMGAKGLNLLISTVFKPIS